MINLFALGSIYRYDLSCMSECGSLCGFKDLFAGYGYQFFVMCTFFRNALVHYIKTYIICGIRQECIPVVGCSCRLGREGCVPGMVVSAQGVVCPWGCLPGVCVCIRAFTGADTPL